MAVQGELNAAYLMYTVYELDLEVPEGAEGGALVYSFDRASRFRADYGL